MNAAAIVTDAEPIADLEDFEKMCSDYVGFWQDGILEKIDAVDCVQHHAELWGMVDAFGQDEIQRIMALAFSSADPVDGLPADYGSQIVKEWELGDLRDRWRHTGELPPKPVPEPARPRYSTPQTTVDAFLFVVGLDDAERLAQWLADHPLDAPQLLNLWEQKCFRPIK